MRRYENEPDLDKLVSERENRNGWYVNTLTSPPITRERYQFLIIKMRETWRVAGLKAWEKRRRNR